MVRFYRICEAEAAAGGGGAEDFAARRSGDSAIDLNGRLRRWAWFLLLAASRWLQYIKFLGITHGALIKGLAQE